MSETKVFIQKAQTVFFCQKITLFARFPFHSVELRVYTACTCVWFIVVPISWPIWPFALIQVFFFDSNFDSQLSSLFLSLSFSLFACVCVHFRHPFPFPANVFVGQRRASSDVNLLSPVFFKVNSFAPKSSWGFFPKRHHCMVTTQAQLPISGFLCPWLTLCVCRRRTLRMRRCSFCRWRLFGRTSSPGHAFPFTVRVLMMQRCPDPNTIRAKCVTLNCDWKTKRKSEAGVNWRKLGRRVCKLFLTNLCTNQWNYQFLPLLINWIILIGKNYLQFCVCLKTRETKA